MKDNTATQYTEREQTYRNSITEKLLSLKSYFVQGAVDEDLVPARWYLMGYAPTSTNSNLRYRLSKYLWLIRNWLRHFNFGDGEDAFSSLIPGS